MEINARVRKLYAKHRSTSAILFIKILSDEFGVSLAEAKEILVKLDYGEEWTLERYQEEVVWPILEELKKQDELDLLSKS